MKLYNYIYRLELRLFMRLKLKIFLIISTILISNIDIFAKCSSSEEFWRAKLKKSQTIEKFFIDNYGCKREFYKSLNSSEKIYFDTVL